MKRIVVCLLAIVIFPILGYSQVNVPLTKTDLNDIQREREIMQMMNIDISQTWLYMVKENLVSTNRILVSEITYNNNACPERMVFFIDDTLVESFTVIKYNNNLLPFEEIRFSADSSLINGIMYMYDDNNLLSDQVNYNNKAEVISRFEYRRAQDSIYIYEYDKNDELISSSIILTNNYGSQELIEKIVKIDAKNKQVEEQYFKYDEMSVLRKKILMKDGESAGYKEFIYNDDGALVKSSYFKDTDNLMNSTSFEYDSYGNMIRILEKEIGAETKVYAIKYLTKID